MGNAMQSLKALLQLPCGWQYSRQVISSDGIPLHLRGKRKIAQCPECFKRSDSVHSCRRRGHYIYPAQARLYVLYFPSATGTAVTLPIHEKSLPSRLLPSPVHISSLHRRYKIYNVNWD